MRSPRLRTAIVWVLASAALGFQPAGSRPGPRTSPRWGLELELKVSGHYRVYQATGPIVGQYSFAVRWKGMMERDDVDWRLVHKSSELVDWKAEETPSPQGPGRVLTSQDFPDKPVFRFLYVLQNEGLIEIQFGTEGFEVPLTPTTQKFPLILPRAAQRARAHGEPSYDQHLTKGSNKILFPEAEMGSSRLEREFSWSWSHTLVQLEQKNTCTCLQRHDARLTIVLEPVR